MSSGTLNSAYLLMHFMWYILLVAVLLYWRSKCWQYCTQLVCTVHVHCCVNTL